MYWLKTILLCCGLLCQVAAYNTYLFTVSDRAFWILSHISFVLFALVIVLQSKGAAFGYLARLTFVLALASLIDELVGNGAFAYFGEYIFAILAIAVSAFEFKMWLHARQNKRGKEPT